MLSPQMKVTLLTVFCGCVLLPLATSHRVIHSHIVKIRNDTVDFTLTSMKMGLAAVMFLYVSTASLLPVIVFACIARRKQNEGETETGNKKRCCCDCGSTQRSTLMGRANCLAAGALLAVGFLDVYLEAIEAMEDALGSLSSTIDFPFTSLITLVGFLSILGIEQLTIHILHHGDHRPILLNHLKEDEFGVLSPSTTSSKTGVQSLEDRRFSNQLQTVAEHESELGHNDRRLDYIVVEDDPQLNSPSINARPLPAIDNPCPVSGPALTPDNPSHISGPKEFKSISIFRYTLLVAAISLHSIFEGLAMGLSKNLTSFLTLYAAVSLHKIVIATSIGINLANEVMVIYAKQAKRTSQKSSSTSKYRIYIYESLSVIAFSGSSPLGIVIGWAVVHQATSSGYLMASAVLQGLACGTILYVVFCELLPKEFHESDADKVLKFLCLLSGVGLVSLVIGVLPDR